MPEYIYTMQRVRKAHGDKVILDDVTLAFLPGAKIGVVGPNGTGKSTLLKMMAGLEQPSNGDARLMPGFTVGMLQQEPPLNEAKTVLGNVEEGVAETKAHARPVQRDRRADGRPTTATSCSTRWASCRSSSTTATPGTSTASSSRRWTPCAARRPTPTSPSSPVVSAAGSRCASCCWSSPTCCCSTSPPTTWTPRACSGWSSHLEKYPGTVLAVTHDRYFLDNVASWILELDRGRCHPYEGNYSTYLETKAARLKVEGQRTPSARSAWRTSWSGSAPTPRPARPRAGPGWQRYEEMAAEADKHRKLDFEEIQIPPGPRLGTTVIEAEQPGQGLRATAC